jgi:hypothetical protein
MSVCCERLIEDRGAKPPVAGTEYERPDTRMDIVAIAIEDGFWAVLNEYEEYAGMCRKGDDITKATGCLNVKWLERLKATP